MNVDGRLVVGIDDDLIREGQFCPATVDSGSSLRADGEREGRLKEADGRRRERATEQIGEESRA